MCLEEYRKELNPRQKALRQALQAGSGEKEPIQKFLILHGILHSARVAPEAPWSYEDLLLDGLDEARFRVIPEGEEHSLVWILWHLSRIEDLTMNLLVGTGCQVFETGGWQAKMGSPIKHTGNGTGLEVTRQLSAAVDIPALRQYRHAVGRATRQVVSGLTCADFTRKVAPEMLQRILDEGAVLPEGIGVVEYWGRRDVAGLLLMPPTRHTIVHWNEARQVIARLR